ncbi:phage tail tape measure protein [Zhouia sp. PK063]|uniref:phage tail tape measure protein n=1 Tax=Zhouia sp. PK063 TaxID=3373602 RepID=UPI0037B53CE2
MAVRGENSLYFSSGIDNTGLKQGANQAVGIIQGLAKEVININPFAGIALGAVTAFATVANESYKMARDFEQAMREVSTISKATQDDFEGISKSVFELSKISPDSPVKLAKAYYQIVSAGHDGSEGLKLLETSAKAAVAGVTDTETAADGLTTILNAFRISADKSNDVADALFNTVKLGKTTFGELAQSISQVAPIAASSNIPLNEVLSIIASLTKQGVPTAQAMTQVRSAIVGMNEAGKLDGTKTLQQNMQSLFDTLNGNQTAIQKEVGRVEALQAILGVSGKNAESANKDLQSYNDTLGATETAFRKMASSNINEWTILGNKIKGATKIIGDYIVDVTSGIAGFFNEALEGSSLTEKQYKSEAAALRDIRLQLEDTNIPLEERKKLIEDLQSKYPSYLGNIKNEGVLTSELKTQLIEVNDQLVKRARLAANQDKIADQADKRDKAEKDRDQARLNLLREIDKVRNKTAVFRENANPTGSALDQIKELERISGSAEAPILRTVQYARQQLIDKQKEYIEQEKALNKLLGTEKDIKKDIVDFGNQSNETNANQSNQSKIDLIAFTDTLKTKQKEYEAYEAVRDLISKEERDNQFKTLLQQGKDYGEYLKNQLEKTKDFAKKQAIALAASSAGINLNRGKVPTVGAITKLPVTLDLNIDTTSINAIQRQLDDLEKQWKAARTKDEADLLKIRVDVKRKELREAEGIIESISKRQSRLTIDLSKLSIKELIKQINEYEKKLDEAQQKLKKLQSSSTSTPKQIDEANTAVTEASANVSGAVTTLQQAIQKIFNDISSAFSEASQLFDKFGDEKTSKLLTQLSGVASGLGQIASGDVIGGSLKALNSALTVEVDTSKIEALEKVINKLEGTIDSLNRTISKDQGSEVVDAYDKAFKAYDEKKKDLDELVEKEKELRKEVKLFGITIGKKGQGSGTDQAKLDEYEEKIKQANEDLEDLQIQFYEFLTGTTSKTIVDSLIDGFKEGKKSVADFADTFEDLMKDALINSFKTKYLADQIDKFYDTFAQYSDSNNDGYGDLTSSEIDLLNNDFNDIINGAQERIDAINEILGQSGLNALGANINAQGLTGAISTITEDTANILSGTLNAIRLDVQSSVGIAQQQSENLSKIAANTAYNRHLETINQNMEYLRSLDNRLATIESGLLQMHGQG